MIKISRSYSRKLNHEAHGGQRFESSDFFACYEEEIPNDHEYTADEIKAKSQTLFNFAKADVDLAVAKEIERLKDKPPF